MNVIFRGDAAFFRAFGRGFYRRRNRLGRSAHQCAVRQLKRRARQMKEPLKRFMKDESALGRDSSSYARAWLFNKKKSNRKAVSR